ncbi:DUF7009 family protein [Mucilaginibacter gilvus]|uniref:Uncharacterized protein n=1 Tax=Mucilaginibacter gilvus TaxID=2305909 RepID=A0A3S3VW99_9SPHI|nr:hypothetical protein [Mucilaginibacter gilvus]RWY57502.1 hypothetical protein EPL05_02955 [Mucilaginibacter gilvus]
MKIRIKGNSLRYRLTKSDVATLATNGFIEETTHFGTQVLRYALRRGMVSSLSATFEDNTITIHMPDQMIEEWVHTDRIGFENSNSAMYLLVEKDFVCLDNVAEDQSDNYPNPLLC